MKPYITGAVKLTIRIVILIALSGTVGLCEINAAPYDNDNTEKDFDPGSFIFDHIADSYEWHVFSFRGDHYSIPLPIILYCSESGLHFFMSNRFDHGYSTYKGFKIESEGPNKGNIVKVDEKGEALKDERLPLDISITKNVLAMFFSVMIILAIFITIGNRYRKKPVGVPRGIQSFFEPLILFVIDEIAKPAIGEKKHERFLPYILTLFFFIWINNMLGLIPLFPMGANVTGNISVTMGLALTSLIAVNFSGNKKYWGHIFNPPGIPGFLKFPIPLMQVIEVVGIFTKPFVLMIRLFANITAGHIITMGFFSLIFIFGERSPYFGFGISGISVLFGIFITFLEFLVALIQAYVFTLLTSLFIGAAVSDDH